MIVVTITCNRSKTKDLDSKNNEIPQIAPTKTGYELHGQQLDSINLYREKLSLPRLERIFYDTSSGMTTIEYYREGSLVIETIF